MTSVSTRPGPSRSRKGVPSDASDRRDAPASLPRADALERAARAASRRSAALGADPPRGAALLTASGEILSAPEIPNDEGGSLAACAERAVLWQAAAAGGRRFKALLLRGGARGGSDAGPPCGACLQVLYEFSPELIVVWGTRARPQGGRPVRELLPEAFGPRHVRRRAPAAAAAKRHKPGVNTTGPRRTP